MVGGDPGETAKQVQVSNVTFLYHRNYAGAGCHEGRLIGSMILSHNGPKPVQTSQAKGHQVIGIIDYYEKSVYRVAYPDEECLKVSAKGIDLWRVRVEYFF
jgi:hypothetical protein